VLGTPVDPKERKQMDNYMKKSIELRKHLTNAVDYMEKDTTNFPLNETTQYFKDLLEGLQELDKQEYPNWLKEQQEAVS
jgi:hypothetical protein